MGSLHWNVYDIAGREFRSRPAIDGRSANLMWLHSFWFYNLPPEHQRGFARFHNPDIHLRLVRFGTAVAFAVRDADHVIVIVSQLLKCEFLLVDLSRQFLAGLLNCRAFPQSKS